MDWQQSLRLVAPEELLSLVSLVLLLVAAWAGDKSSRAISIIAVGALFGNQVLFRNGFE